MIDAYVDDQGGSTGLRNATASHADALWRSISMVGPRRSEGVPALWKLRLVGRRQGDPERGCPVLD